MHIDHTIQRLQTLIPGGNLLVPAYTVEVGLTRLRENKNDARAYEV